MPPKKSGAPPKRAKEEDVPDDAQETICSICLEIFKDPITLHCGHSLCRACVMQVANAERNACVAECCRKEKLRPNAANHRTARSFMSGNR